MIFVVFKPYYTRLNPQKSCSMKKIYILLLFAAFSFIGVFKFARLKLIITIAS